MRVETIGDCTLYLGDCLEVLPTLGKVDAVVTDPPYGTGAWKRTESGAGSDCRATLQIESWDVWDTKWIDDVNAETVGLFLPRVNLISFVRMFVWIKPDPRPRFSDQPAYGFEPFIIHRGSVKRAGGMDYIIASSPRLNRDDEAVGHPHQKPESVMQWAVQLCAEPGAIVLDPYMGSGTTGVACVKTGRRFIGVEIDPTYFDIACKRIEAATLQLRLPLEEP